LPKGLRESELIDRAIFASQPHEFEDRHIALNIWEVSQDELSWGLWDRFEVFMSGLFCHVNLLLKTRVFVRKKPGR
jgi:hypothetical protein